MITCTRRQTSLWSRRLCHIYCIYFEKVEIFNLMYFSKRGDTVFYTYLIRVGTNTCNITAYRNTVSWKCGRDSWARNVSKVGYAVTLRAFSVCCRYLAVASKGWYSYGRSRCGRATWHCTSTPAPAITVSSLWCDSQIPTAHRTSP